MNILVVNFTRFGDLLQSAAAIRSLAVHEDGPDKIGMVCHADFAPAAALLPGVSDIFPFPSDTILTALANPTPSRNGWLQGLKELHSWIDAIRTRFKPERVINLSPTVPSCLVGSLFTETGQCDGFAIDPQGFRRNTSLWASFLQGSASSRSSCVFNVVDIFRKITGSATLRSNGSLEPIEEPIVKRVGQVLRAGAPPDTKGYVALQLGASAAIRQWPTESFAATGDALWEKHRLLPVLVGASSEQIQEEKYAAHAANPYISLIGKTTVLELGAALTLSHLLISNDTGTLHLASGLGVPVIGIYLATAQPWDTGPFGEGNLSVEPDLTCHPCEFDSACSHALACHTAVKPETVIALAAMRLADTTENFSPPNVKGARIWRSTIDAEGFADLTSISGHGGQPRTQWLRLQRQLYRQFFDRNPGFPSRLEPPSCDIHISGETGVAFAKDCDAIIMLFDILLQQGTMLSTNPVPVIKENFQRTLQRLTSQLAASSHFKAVGFMWREEIMAQQSLETTMILIPQYRELFHAIRAAL